VGDGSLREVGGSQPLLSSWAARPHPNRLPTPALTLQQTSHPITPASSLLRFYYLVARLTLFFFVDSTRPLQGDRYNSKALERRGCCLRLRDSCTDVSRDLQLRSYETRRGTNQRRRGAGSFVAHLQNSPPLELSRG